VLNNGTADPGKLFLVPTTPSLTDDNCRYDYSVRMLFPEGTSTHVVATDNSVTEATDNEPTVELPPAWSPTAAPRGRHPATEEGSYRFVAKNPMPADAADAPHMVEHAAVPKRGKPATMAPIAFDPLAIQVTESTRSSITIVINRQHIKLRRDEVRTLIEVLAAVER
jgi:hypothetical protein